MPARAGTGFLVQATGRRRESPAAASGLVWRTGTMVFPGSDMKGNCDDHRTDTTLRDLMATIGDVAFEYADDDTEEAYEIACLIDSFQCTR